MKTFYRFFERLVDPFEVRNVGRPPKGGVAFIRHFASQMKATFIIMLALGGLTALVEASLFVFLGLIVDMMNGSKPELFFEANLNSLIAMAVVVALVRAAIAISTAVLEEQIVVPGFFTRVRWQSHKSISQQDVSFFDDELAGRVSSKVWQAGQATGDVVIALLQIIWFIAVFAATSLVMIAQLSIAVMVPVLLWLVAVSAIARIYVPRIRERGRELAEISAIVTGRMVDGYANIRTVKLYDAGNDHNEFIRQGWDEALVKLRQFTRTISGMRISFQSFSSVMLVVIAVVCLWQFSQMGLTAGEVAVVLALCLRLNLLLGRLLGLLNGLFRNFGTVQNSAELISQQPKLVDTADATELQPVRGEVRFDRVEFSYNKGADIIEELSLVIPAGQKVGIVGQSGVGKSTLMNLLLRFYDVDSGRISLDGNDISKVTQVSLRAQFGLVSQDTSLMHQSIARNISFGRSGAGMEEIIQAAKRANAHEFILALADSKGRTGYDTLVGERGVKLSGGQRQRIAIARVFLRDAPILLLDEATSALDSEVEAAIQENMHELMHEKTVIAIAHRLSTIADLDRLLVMQDGKIVEDGDHKTLLKNKGLYARLWERQSGGFVAN